MKKNPYSRMSQYWWRIQTPEVLFLNHVGFNYQFIKWEIEDRFRWLFTVAIKAVSAQNRDNWEKGIISVDLQANAIESTDTLDKSLGFQRFDQWELWVLVNYYPALIKRETLKQIREITQEVGLGALKK